MINLRVYRLWRVAVWSALATAVTLRGGEPAPTVFTEPGRGRIAIQVAGNVPRSGTWFYVVNDARLSEVMAKAGAEVTGNEAIFIRRPGTNGGQRWHFRAREYDVRFDFAPGDLVCVGEH